MFKDVLFGTVVWALVGFAGHVLFGDIEGVALWRTVWFAGAGGWLGGCCCRQWREERRYIRRRSPRWRDLYRGGNSMPYRGY